MGIVASLVDGVEPISNVVEFVVKRYVSVVVSTSRVAASSSVSQWREFGLRDVMEWQWFVECEIGDWVSAPVVVWSFSSATKFKVGLVSRDASSG